MSDRELVVLGTSSRMPTRTRNHNGYLLLWDGEKMRFTNDEEANAMLDEPYRDGWTL